MPTTTPRRLIIGVDGTWCTADGAHGRGEGNVTNVYRICSSIKIGLVTNTKTGLPISQESYYEPGIGSADDIGSWSRIQAGVFGEGVQDKIRDIYRKCCALNENDEIWLYGFSRGAFIVRAVAGLLTNVGALTASSDAQFKEQYKGLLKIYGSNAKRSTVGMGQIHAFLRQEQKPAAKIKFVGVFDTVKAVSDQDLYDVSLNNGVQHLRHALALNENRQAMTPEYIYPDMARFREDHNHSFVQAWFAGAHIDMGGSSRKDGLALYPLQWMLLESEKKGLVLEFSHQFSHKLNARIDNPIHVVFPSHELHGQGMGKWSCVTANGVEVAMQDLRLVHEPSRWAGRYALAMNIKTHIGWPKRERQVFNSDKTLRGYCSWHPSGTIIHPSVFQLLDESPAIALHKSWTCREQIEIHRKHILGERRISAGSTDSSVSLLNHGFWSTREHVEVEDIGALRILVCGNTGIGKSTLINRIFGVEVTASSGRSRGIHRVEEPLTHDSRPDLIVHDSGGFEAGSRVELTAVENFVRQRAQQIRVHDRLHVIWFCVEMNSDRPAPVATVDLFEAVSKYASDIPLIIVATKSDDYRDIVAGRARRRLTGSGLSAAEFEQYVTEEADIQVQKRLDMMQEELAGVAGGRCDGCIAVNHDNLESIELLNKITWESFSHEKVRLAYVAAQTVDIDIKIELSIMEVMTIYRNVLGTATGLALVPGASTTNRTAAAFSICYAILKCFGIPTLNARTVYKIVKNILWDDFGHNLAVGFAEGIATLGMGASIFSFGMIPLFLAAEIINVPLVVPATTRLMLMLSADVILILARAFKKTTFTCVGQPGLADVQRAAVEYKRLSARVHPEILQLVPRRNLAASYRCHEVKAGLTKIIDKYKSCVTKDFDDDAENLKSISVTPRYAQREERGSDLDKELGKDVEDILSSHRDARTNAPEDVRNEYEQKVNKW